jgi:hypothetical protein
VGRIEEEPDRWSRSVAALGAGALLAVAVALAGSTIRGGARSLLPPPGAPAWWIADRDADAVYALDRAGILGTRVAIPRPVAVRSTSDGGAWIVRSTTATARGERRLVRIRSDGSAVAEIPIGNHPELAVLEGGDAVVVEDGDKPDGPRRLVRCSEDGDRRVLLEERGLACAIGCGDRGLVGSETGDVRRFDAENGAWTGERVRLEGPIVAFGTAGPGSEYVLHGLDGAHLSRLEADLSIAWSVPCAARRAGLAATPGGDHVWIVDLEARSLRKFNRAGTLALERVVSGSGEIGRWAAAGTGGVVLATPGALLVFDEQGNARPGQGGFAFVVDIDRIPGR